MRSVHVNAVNFYSATTNTTDSIHFISKTDTKSYSYLYYPWFLSGLIVQWIACCFLLVLPFANLPYLVLEQCSNSINRWVPSISIIPFQQFRNFAACSSPWRYSNIAKCFTNVNEFKTKPQKCFSYYAATVNFINQHYNLKTKGWQYLRSQSFH